LPKVTNFVKMFADRHTGTNCDEDITFTQTWWQQAECRIMAYNASVIWINWYDIWNRQGKLRPTGKWADYIKNGAAKICVYTAWQWLGGARRWR